jgi:hypothetical protein
LINDLKVKGLSRVKEFYNQEGCKGIDRFD